VDILVPLMIGLPVAGAILLLILRSADANVTRWGALFVTAASAICSVAVAVQFLRSPVVGDASDPIATRWQLAHTWMEYGSAGTRSASGVSLGIGLPNQHVAGLVNIAPVAGIGVGSWRSIDKRVTEYFVCLLLLETGC
jgi:NADH:ubiquinone oxidoreductase subunit 4 (subunit M)